MKPIPVAEEEARVSVQSDPDIVVARMRGRALAVQLGFPTATATLISTAISELARNILLYAKRGEVVLSRVHENGHRGLAVLARDDGPGISNVTLAMQDGYSTSGRLGLGLPGVRRLMDEFEVRSVIGGGTTVMAKKWKD